MCTSIIPLVRFQYQDIWETCSWLCSRGTNNASGTQAFNTWNLLVFKKLYLESDLFLGESIHSDWTNFSGVESRPIKFLGSPFPLGFALTISHSSFEVLWHQNPFRRKIHVLLMKTAKAQVLSHLIVEYDVPRRLTQIEAADEYDVGMIDLTMEVIQALENTEQQHYWSTKPGKSGLSDFFMCRPSCQHEVYHRILRWNLVSNFRGT